METERMMGIERHRIDYHHIIDSLIRKPGAICRYRFRADLYPHLVFRQAYDALIAGVGERKADVDYARILHLSARTMEQDVKAALELLLEAGEIPRADRVKELVCGKEASSVPLVAEPEVDLKEYDALMENYLEEAG